MVLPERPLTFPRASACARSTGTISGVLWRHASSDELHRLIGMASAPLVCWEAASGRAWSDWDDLWPCVSPHAVLPLRVSISAHAEAAGGRDLLRCAHTQLIRCNTDKKLTRSRCWREKFSSVNMSLFVSYLLSGTVCGVLSTQARPGGEFELFRASALDTVYCSGGTGGA